MCLGLPVRLVISGQAKAWILASMGMNRIQVRTAGEGGRQVFTVEFYDWGTREAVTTHDRGGRAPEVIAEKTVQVLAQRDG